MYPKVFTVTIAASSTSISFSAGEYTRGSFQLPSAFTGATVTVNVSNDDANWTACSTNSADTNEVNPITVSADGTYHIPPKAFDAKYIQLVSASSEAAARDITVFLR